MSANDIHTRLEAALRELQRAEKNAVLLFGEMLRRKLYQDLGYSSIQTYAAEALGFTPSKTSQFVRLAGALEELPRLRRSVAAGELGWTKAREVAKVATPDSEEQWITEAGRSSSRSLEEKVRVARQRARRAAQVDDQPMLELADLPSDPEPADVPVTVSTTFTSEQYARYEALLETIRKRAGRSGSTVRGANRAELLLAALNDLAENLDQGSETGAAAAPPYQVVVYTFNFGQVILTMGLVSFLSVRSIPSGLSSHLFELACAAQEEDSATPAYAWRNSQVHAKLAVRRR